MKALRLHEPDGIDALSIEEVPRPEPGDDELLVQVRAAGVNQLDWLMSDGVLAEQVEYPWTPGWDVSGTVTAVGADVAAFEVGDDVFGMPRLPNAGGTFAEYAIVTPEEVTAKPDSLSHVQAAGIPLASQTAYHALFEEAAVGSGDEVLVHAAAGGVGHFAVQFATAVGAHVTGTASASNERHLRTLGVDEFVDYREHDFEDVVDDVDVVLDAVGGDTPQRSIDVTKPGGTVVTLPAPPDDDLVRSASEDRDVDVRNFSVIADSEPAALAAIADRVDAGVVQPLISDVYSFSETTDALQRSADGHVRGKLVVEVGNEDRD